MYRVEVPSLPPSLNKFYAGMHYRKRKEYADEWHGLFLGAFREAGIPRPLPYPITLDVTQFSCPERDCDNSVISAKFALDALVGGGWLPDDSPEYVRCVVLHSARCDTKRKNKTVILIL